MAADQRRKRVNGASIVGYGSREQHRTKRKNLGQDQNDLKMRSHISVKWDSNQKRVVAKRDQIGISRRQMKPFVYFFSNDHKVLADVFTVPQEIFDLDNLSDVLSYEVWKTHLSEDERNLLMQFLPSGLEPDHAVEELLAGSNFQCGNPFLKWGASLCLGDLHPDMIVDREHHLKSEKRAYYSQLHNYHNDMIGFLSKLMERWQSCKDPEKDFVQNIRRSNHEEKKMLSNVNESRICDRDGNVTVTSDSCSWDAQEKACSSDNQISALRNDDKLQRRVLKKCPVKGKSRNLMLSSDDTRIVGENPMIGEEVRKRNVQFIDGDKYMSCIKISRQQHELVKSMKQSGKSIQSRSLNRVLGNLDDIHVQPYKVFVREEQKKLHEHWLLMVNKDLPVAHANWTMSQIQRHTVRNSLVEEMKVKSNPILEEADNVSSGSDLQVQDEDNMSAEGEHKDQSEDNMSAGGELKDQSEDNVSLGGELKDQSEDTMSLESKLHDQNDNVNSGSEFQDQDENTMSSGNGVQNQLVDGCLNDQPNMKGDEDSFARALDNQSPHNSYVSDDEKFNQMSVDSEKNLLSKSDTAATPNKDEYSKNISTKDVSIDEGPFTSGGDVWQAVEMPQSYYNSAATHEYTTDGLSLANPQAIAEERTHLIDHEADLHREETSKELLHRRLDDTTFSSYQSQDRSVLLPSLFKGEGLLPYHEQKGAGLHFPSSNSIMMGGGQSSNRFKDPLQMSLTLDQGQRRAAEVFMPQSMPENIYLNGGRYLMSRQDMLVPTNVTGWAAADTARIAAPSHPQLNTGDFTGHQWFPADHQVRGGWNGSGSGSLSSQGLVAGTTGGWNGSVGGSLSSQSLGTGTNSDQSLFSILSQFNQLPSGSPYDSVRNTDQFLVPRPYGVVDAATPRVNAVAVNAVAPQASHPLDYLMSREPPSGLVPDDMAWVSLPHQSSALHDQMGKPYLRSWNR